MNKIVLNSYDGASASIAHQGAHLCSWIPAGGTEQLFMSQTSEFREGVAIRGGIPLIFPQFAALGSLPKHGFARTSAWDFVRCGAAENGAAEATFQLRDNPASQALWPHSFLADLKVTVFANQLKLDFSVQNMGSSSLQFTSALHTYFRVNSLEQTSVHGLHGLGYHDSVNGSNSLEKNEALHVDGEFDRIYVGVSQPLEIRQGHQRLFLQQSGFQDAVVWNPGAEKARNLSDLETDGYRRMLCVESACIRNPVVLQPREHWLGSMQLSVRTYTGN